MRNIYLLPILLVFLLSCDGNTQLTIFKRIEFQHPYPTSPQIDSTFRSDTTSSRYHNARKNYALIGLYTEIEKLDSLEKMERFSTGRLKELDNLHLYHQEDAHSYILREAKKHRVLIINEAHDHPQHRLFTKTLLKELSKLGYNQLGLEALNNWGNTDSLLQNHHYPIHSMGNYLKEVQLGNMIRTAQTNGINIFAYEDFKGFRGEKRERIQALQIAERMKNYPNDRFIIHCGYAHVLEGKHTVWSKSMAGFLKEYSGEDPFTIDQTLFQTNYNLSKLDLSANHSPIVLMDSSSTPLGYSNNKTQTDVSIIHPPFQYAFNRPNPLFYNPNCPFRIALSSIHLEYPILLIAYPKGENIRYAVPTDIVEAYSSADTVYMALPAGEHSIIATSPTDYSVQFTIHNTPAR